MPYLNLDPSYPEHPKTIRLIGLLGEMSDAIPVRLWAYCARVHAENGTMLGYTESEIESVLKWRGEPGKAVSALVHVGFLERLENGFQCHDWLDHEGHLEALSRRAKTAAKARWSSYASSNAKRKRSNA